MQKAFVVVFLIFLSTAVMAQSAIGFRAVGGKLAVVDPENIEAVVGFGAFADLGTIAPNIALEATVDYWSKSESSAFGAEASVSDLAVGGLVKYLFMEEEAPLRPFVGGGLGIHFVGASRLRQGCRESDSPFFIALA